jgi:two-component system cell cycle response regulator CpdR
MSIQGPQKIARIAIDCAGRGTEKVVSLIGEALSQGAPAGAHTTLVLENLRKLEGSLVEFLLDLSRRLASSHVRACIVDPSGLTSTFFEAFARSLPIAAFDDESMLARRKRVLVVEDDDETLEFLRTLLESCGHGCVIARSARKAFRFLEQEAFDLVLLDLVLPDADGMTVARHVLERGLPTPVVAVSGFLQLWTDDVYQESGISRRVSKPIRGRDLLEAVARS